MYSFKGKPSPAPPEASHSNRLLGDLHPPFPALVRSWGQQGKIKCTLSSSWSTMLLKLKLATKVSVLQERGVKDGFREDREETSPGAFCAPKSVQMDHH